MKKYYVVSFAALIWSLNISSQILQTEKNLTPANPNLSYIHKQSNESPMLKTASTSVNDTLHYFFSKHYYRNLTTPASAPPNLSFLTIKSPYTNPLLEIDHCGALFLNSSNILVHGLEGLVIKNAGSVSPSVTVKLYLCNVNGVTNLPILPPLDSVVTSVSNSTAGVWAGGTFTAPVSVSGKFAVLFNIDQNAPAGDTVRLFLNNAFTNTATVPTNQKFGEGLGIIRFNGNFQATTGAFGGTAGNDYEFIVAPYVSYQISAGAAANSATICNLSNGSFTNTSSPIGIIENRQFNFNKFKPYWAPTNTLMPTTTDSIYNWAFSGTSTGTSTAKNPTAYFNVLGNQTAALTVKQRYSTVGYGNSSVSDVAMTTISVTSAAAPTITVSGETNFCTNNAAITTTLYCTGNPTYTWSAPLNTVASVVVITQTASTVIYTVMASNGGCTAVKTVSVTKRPIPTVSLSASTSTFCTSSTGGSSVTILGLPVGGVYSGTGVSGNSFSPPNAAGTYTPVYSFTNATSGCTNSATTSMLVLDCTGLNSFANDNRFKVFPNPSLHGKLNLQADETIHVIEVFNMLGIQVLKQTISSNFCEIDLSQHPEGNYILRIELRESGVKTLKIVNQN